MWMNFKIIKKGKIYFDAINESDFNSCCRIRIDENSANLGLGYHFLNVNDISINNSYGIDMKYEVIGKQPKICTLKAPKNSRLNHACLKLGGRWEPNDKVWIFSNTVEKEVEALEEKYTSKMVGIEITVLQDKTGYDLEPFEICGWTIGKAYGRDSGVRLEPGIAIITGYVVSTGSKKNWHVCIREGTIIRMEIPKLCVADLDELSWLKYSILGDKNA